MQIFALVSSGQEHRVLGGAARKSPARPHHGSPVRGRTATKACVPRSAPIFRPPHPRTGWRVVGAPLYRQVWVIQEHRGGEFLFSGPGLAPDQKKNSGAVGGDGAPRVHGPAALESAGLCCASRSPISGPPEQASALTLRKQIPAGNTTTTAAPFQVVPRAEQVVRTVLTTNGFHLHRRRRCER